MDFPPPGFPTFNPLIMSDVVTTITSELRQWRLQQKFFLSCCFFAKLLIKEQVSGLLFFALNSSA